jgi:hypothetical protein
VTYLTGWTADVPSSVAVAAHWTGLTLDGDHELAWSWRPDAVSAGVRCDGGALDEDPVTSLTGWTAADSAETRSASSDSGERLCQGIDVVAAETLLADAGPGGISELSEGGLADPGEGPRGRRLQMLERN